MMGSPWDLRPTPHDPEWDESTQHEYDADSDYRVPFKVDPATVTNAWEVEPWCVLYKGKWSAWSPDWVSDRVRHLFKDVGRPPFELPDV